MNYNYIDQNELSVEIVERKGMGHPDTLADRLAETLSNEYSRYTLDRYGAVLHHNFDKVGLMGGLTRVGFGDYDICSPIRVLLNGRASSSFSGEQIPLREMLENTTKSFLTNNLNGINKDKDIIIMYEVASGSSPGSVGDSSKLRNNWFSPESLEDLSELKHLNCNDTSLGAAFYNKRIVEKCVWEIEQDLSSDTFRREHEWIGSDIKIMGFRKGNTIRFTMAIPQLASKVNSITEYRCNKDFLYEYIHNALSDMADGYSIELFINTRDKFTSSTDLYLTATGSSIEMGDEGFVGRGNRMGGLITPFRPYTMEGICGKNPVYHTGKMYSVAAWEISKEIYYTTGEDLSVLIIGQSGHSLNKPWSISFVGSSNRRNRTCHLEIADSILSNFGQITTNILREKYPMC